MRKSVREREGEIYSKRKIEKERDRYNEIDMRYIRKIDRYKRYGEREGQRDHEKKREREIERERNRER